MIDLPGNRQTERSPEPETPKNEDKQAKPEKVVSGKVLRRKQSLGTRFVKTFFSSENSVWNYLLNDVLIPAAKDTVADFVSQGIERAVYGEARSSSRRTGTRPGGSGGFVSYNRFGPNARPAHREEPRTMSRRARASHDFEEIVLSTRSDATQVIDGMFELVSKYDQVTVSDLYNLIGVDGTFADEKWGWRDIRGASVVRVTNGYLLDLPKPEHLD
jgi:hypothetical protein